MRLASELTLLLALAFYLVHREMPTMVADTGAVRLLRGPVQVKRINFGERRSQGTCRGGCCVKSCRSNRRNSGRAGRELRVRIAGRRTLRFCGRMQAQRAAFPADRTRNQRG